MQLLRARDVCGNQVGCPGSGILKRLISGDNRDNIIDTLLRNVHGFPSLLWFCSTSPRALFGEDSAQCPFTPIVYSLPVTPVCQQHNERSEQARQSTRACRMAT